MWGVGVFLLYMFSDEKFFMVWNKSCGIKVDVWCCDVNILIIVIVGELCLDEMFMERFL